MSPITPSFFIMFNHRLNSYDFFSNTLIQDAVVRNLEIVGEAVKNLSSNLKTAHSEISWKSIAGMRDKLIHQYFGVDYNLIWDTVQNDMPKLKAIVEIILQSKL